VIAGLVQRLRDVLHEHVEIPVVVRLLGLPCGSDVLQVGCGTGVAFARLQRLLRPASLVGVDFDRTGLASVRVRCAQADLLALPFADRSFDLVIDFGTCQHVPDRASALAEVVRVLRPGGIFVHELPAAQLIAHPSHFHRGRGLPATIPGLGKGRRAGLWASHRRSW
jgi:ubiquinone/menaquinone biosynthesis C-methylase UbiE